MVLQVFATALDDMVADGCASECYTGTNLVRYIQRVNTTAQTGLIRFKLPKVTSGRHTDGGWPGQRISDWQLNNVQPDPTGARPFVYVQISGKMSIQRLSDEKSDTAPFELNLAKVLWPGETALGRMPPPDLGKIHIGAMYSYFSAHCAITYAARMINEAVRSNASSGLHKYNITFDVDFTPTRVTSAGDVALFIREYDTMVNKQPIGKVIELDSTH